MRYPLKRRLTSEDFTSSEPQDQDESAAEHEFQCGPEHAHEANQFQAAANVLFVLAFKSSDLRFFLHVSPNKSRTRKILLCPRGDVGEHCLNTLEAFVNAASESLNDDADGGQRQEREERQPGADRDHERERTGGVDNGVRRIHDRGSEQHANGIQVVGGARHNVAGAMALIVRVAETLEVGEEVVAEIELDV